MSELIKRSEDWLDYHKGAPWETDAMKLIAELVKRVKELEQQLATAHREGWEQAKESSQRTIQQLEAMNKALMEQSTKGVSMQPTPIMIANADAHRMGWEQCQRECGEVVNNFAWGRYRENEYEFDLMTERISDAIAAMEYGGKANTHL